LGSARQLGIVENWGALLETLAADVRAGLRAENGFKQVTWQRACVAVQAVNHSSIVVDQEKASNKTSDPKGPLTRVDLFKVQSD
jgi:hypothetical protein